MSAPELDAPAYFAVNPSEDWTSSLTALPIYNSGLTRLNLDSLFEESGTVFQLMEPLTVDYLPPGDSLTLNIRFTPTAKGQFTENLTLYSNDEDEPVKIITLEGSCIDLPPSAPSGVQVTDSLQVVTLQWTPNPEPDIGYYRVYRDISPQVEALTVNLIGQTNATECQFSDPSIENMVTYYYLITAVDTAWHESEPSAVIKVTAIYIEIQQVSFQQRRDGSMMVDVYYSFTGQDSTQYLTSARLSLDDGQNWDDLGVVGQIQPGSNRHYIFDFGTLYPNLYIDQARVKLIVYANQTKLIEGEGR